MDYQNTITMFTVMYFYNKKKQSRRWSKLFDIYDYNVFINWLYHLNLGNFRGANIDYLWGVYETVLLGLLFYFFCFLTYDEFVVL